MFTLRILKVFTVFVLTTSPALAQTPSWTYADQANWPGQCTTGRQQSPINIDTNETFYELVPRFVFDYYNIKFNATLINTGHRIEVTLDTNAENQPTIYGANLPDKFKFNNFHFHWSAEHTINGDRLPLEMHMIHYDQIYPSPLVAENYENGLATLGILFQLSPEDNTALNPIFEVLPEVNRNPGRTVSLREPIALSSFLPDTNTFYRYYGSQTTPNCSQVVTWTIFTSYNSISQRQLDSIHNITGYTGLLNATYRNSQPLNGRQVIHAHTERSRPWYPRFF